MFKAIMKLFKNSGIEGDQLLEIASGVAELIENEVKSRAEQVEPQEPVDVASLQESIEKMIQDATNANKPSENETDGEGDEDEAENETVKTLTQQLQQLKDAAIGAELATWGITKGYEDVVKNLIDFSNVTFENGVLKNLKEKKEAIAESRPLLFGSKNQGYTPPAGKAPDVTTDIAKAMKKKDFNLTEFLKNQRSE